MSDLRCAWRVDPACSRRRGRIPIGGEYLELEGVEKVSFDACYKIYEAARKWETIVPPAP